MRSAALYNGNKAPAKQNASRMMILSVGVACGCSLWLEGAAMTGNQGTLGNCHFVRWWRAGLCRRQQTPPTLSKVEHVLRGVLGEEWASLVYCVFTLLLCGGTSADDSRRLVIVTLIAVWSGGLFSPLGSANLQLWWCSGTHKLCPLATAFPMPWACCIIITNSLPWGFDFDYNGVWWNGGWGKHR